MRTAPGASPRSRSGSWTRGPGSLDPGSGSGVRASVQVLAPGSGYRFEFLSPGSSSFVRVSGKRISRRAFFGRAAVATGYRLARGTDRKLLSRRQPERDQEPPGRGIVVSKRTVYPKGEPSER